MVRAYRRVDFVTADLLTDDFGAALYDACLLGQITHYLTATQNVDLFRRVHAALRPGGRWCSMCR